MRAALASLAVCAAAVTATAPPTSTSSSSSTSAARTAWRGPSTPQSVSFATSGRPNELRPAPPRPAVVAPEHRASPMITGGRCSPGASWQTWTWTKAGQIVSGNGTCLTAASWPPQNGVALVSAPCGSVADPAQQLFNFTPGGGNSISITLPSQPSFCANLAQYGTAPGTQVWLWTCSQSDCEANCAWQWESGQQPSQIVNPNSGLCLDNGEGPPVPRTCDPGSPAAGLPFCDPTLDLDTRIDDLWSRLDNSTLIDLFSIPINPNNVIANLSFPSIYWDITCIAGLSPGRMSPQPNVTVFPCTTAQSASFDVNLTATIGQATALEGRIVNQVNYRLTGGQTFQGVLCDGGPLANTQHDPRWGRVSETYGEDYYLTAAMGIAATRALQQRLAPDSTGLDLLMTSQVTRHYMGTHGASDLPNDAEEYILPQYREEHQMRVYEAFQRPDMGDAEGVMCAISAFAEAGDVPPPRNNRTAGVINYTPNCVNTFLLDEKLRTEWDSGCFIQSDCCDSITAIVDHHYENTLEMAVADAVNAGLSSSYGYGSIPQALVAALADGFISADTYEKRIKRTLRTFFRVGVFDSSNPNNPYRGPWDESQLDGPQHRALARDAVGRTTVLLENRGGAALPLSSFPKNVAVIGPFSDCTDLEGGYGGHDDDSKDVCNYGHSYSGFMSAVSTYRSAALEEAQNAGNGAQVTWVRGSKVLNPDGTTGLANASAAAAAADLVLLVLGTGTQIEVEGRDRTTLTLPQPQLDLVSAVTGSIPPTSKLVIVLVTSGTVDFSEPRADALLYAAYPGEETGHGMWDILMGRSIASAKMPLTTFRNSYLNIIPPVANFNMISSVAGFPVGRTYRYFNDTDAVQRSGANESYILYHFGYGLSYCNYSYSGLAIQPQPDNSVTVQVHVQATSRSSSLSPSAPPCREVTQVYVSLPPASGAGGNSPVYSLAAFASTELPNPGNAPTELHFTIAADAFLSTYVNGTRALAGGNYTVYVGGHLPDDAKAQAGTGSVTLMGQVALPWSG